MSDRDALRAAIRANPDEDTPRLAFADWLDERGDAFFSHWAALIRTQIEAANAERIVSIASDPYTAGREALFDPCP
jgi:uncharacterized protein (TIGR02996 family)